MGLRLFHVAAAAALLATFVYGFAIGKWRVFPSGLVAGVAGQSEAADEPERKTQFDYFAPKVDVVFLGDSITAQGNWHDMFPSISLANRGVGGDNVIDIQRRLDGVTDLEPSRIFVMAGINDIEDQDPAPVDYIVTTYEDIVATLVESGADVYVQSTLECSVSACGAELEAVRQVNERLEAFADTDENIQFIDINDELSDRDGLRSEFTRDGVHLNANGYVAWRGILASHVEGVER